MFDVPLERSPEARMHRVQSAKCASPEPGVAAYAEVGGMGMGRLSDGSVYLTQRGLARLCGVQNAHIGTIGRDWNTDKPRILAVKARLARFGEERASPYRVLTYDGHRQYAYDMAVVQAVLDYFALDAGQPQAEAIANRDRFRGAALENHIRAHLAPEPVETLRFTPVRKAQPDSPDVIDAMVLYVCGLYALSIFLAASYLEGLKERALNARWNRLGLYLPLKAFLEVQAEAFLRASKAFMF